MDFSGEKTKYTERHPMADTENSFKYLYAFGLGVMAMGHMRAITELQTHYEHILRRLQLSDHYREQIVGDVNNYLEARLTDVFRQIVRKEERYCLLLDLFQMQEMALWSEDFCRGIVENYLQVFHLSDAECDFLRTFDRAARAGDVKRAVEAYERFRKQGYEISYRTLKYFFPDFERISRFPGMTIHVGETVVLDGPVEMNGDIIVERGGSLLLYGTELHMRGGIRLQGGRIRFRDANVQVLSCSQKYFLELRDTAVVQMESTVIDCGGCCGLLLQEGGRLIINSCRLSHSKGVPMIRFAGSTATMERTNLKEGGNGLLYLEKAAKMKIVHCLFQEGSSEYGGGIYSESIGNVLISDSRFLRCQAKYLGGAVYFKYHKYGQSVEDCQAKDCKPEEQPFFHNYEETKI
ncbi:MAG: right-handed parallel beta-helix repeat-containing protein [Lachnospiraceae bacterium]|nr:right-handed parallel beta-helix repeat-containing protein [Lachnospiraceae bacterium]